MFFNSLSFIFVFLPFVLAGYFILGKGKRGQIILAAASLFFYFLLVPEYLPLLLVSIAFNYMIGHLLIRARENPEQKSLMSYILFIGILGDLGLLGYCKYFNFVIVSLDQFLGFSLPAPGIILLLGVSFFTFTQIAFIVDTYRGFVRNINPLSYIQFVTFFPHLIAGPIYHHSDIIPQLEDETKHQPDWTNMNLGVFLFFFGLAKKVVIADTLAWVSGLFFTSVASGGNPMLLDAWFGILAYTLQIYFDFSGYCDMAIGLALLFNIRLPINFFSPYKVTSIIDFWRSWNITLSYFLRDYLYIPLGGNRYGVPVQIRNLMITMLLGGLWHGAGWTFLIWGGLHGFYLVINHLWRKTGIVLHSYFCWLVTFLAVIIAWVFFRANSVASALRILNGMIGRNGISVPASFPDLGIFHPFGFTTMLSAYNVIGSVSVIAGLLIVLLLPNLYDITRKYQTALISEKQSQIKRIDPLKLPVIYTISVHWSVIVGIIATVAIIWVQTTSEFLYFQF